MRMILIIFSVLIVAGAAVGGCGSEDGGSADEEVLATTGILHSITERIAAEDIAVDQLIPDSADPHDFSLSAPDRLQLQEAPLVIANGAGLEPGIPLEAAGPVWELVEHAGELRQGDPHVWMDPTRVAAALPSLADALAEVDPAHADNYRRRAVSYARELERLDGSIEKQLSAIPPQHRKLVTSHDSLGYFADRYGLEVVASPFGPLGAEAEPSAGAVQEAIEAVERTGVPAVFAQAEDDPSVMAQISGESGVEVIEGLLVESPGPAGTYAAMLRRDAELISRALDE